MDAVPEQAGPLAFGDFLEYLRRQGFTFGIDDYLRLQELLNKMGGDCAPADLKTRLCPLLATNPFEQEQFYEAFDQYFDLFQTAPAAASRRAPDVLPVARDIPQPARKRKLLYVLAGLLAVALVIAGVLFVKSRRTAPNAQADLNNLSPPMNARTDPNVADFSRRATASLQTQSEVQGYFYQRYGRAIHLSMVALPLLGFLIYEWHRFRRRNLLLEKQRLKKPPFVWPLKVEAPAASLYDAQQLHAVARRMRQRQLGELDRLDVAATVTATIAARGYPSFRYARDSRTPEYLVLIDRCSFRDHQARLFDELAKALEREGLFIRRYFYDTDPRVCWTETGASVELVELQNRYGEHRLLIFGEGERMIDPVTGKLESWATIFEEWPERALFTPEVPSQWGLREIILAEPFVLLPATLEGLLAAVDYFELPAATDLRAWQRGAAAAPPADLESAGVVARLRRYLGEESFQWLCACAVYTEVHWDLTLYLGALACMPQGLLTEERLAKLIRLPWFRSGTMPDELRWPLIRELDGEKEAAIRAAIIELMEKNPPPRETFAADTYQLNLVVQRWLSRRERKRRREVLQALEGLPQSRAVGDYTLLRSLESARLSPLDFLLPRRLRRLFYGRGLSALGARTWMRLLGALTLSTAAFLIYLGVYQPRSLSTAHSKEFSSADLGRRNIAVRPANSSCFACHTIVSVSQDKCIDCHRTHPTPTMGAFEPTAGGTHQVQGIVCSSCHKEHRGKDIYAGLVVYQLCADCHNGTYMIKAGPDAGQRLPVPHGGRIGYPVVNGEWVWKLTPEQIKSKGYLNKWASWNASDQFHAVHQMGYMVNRMSCGDCHSRGRPGDEEFRNSPKDECAKCHSVSFTTSDSTAQLTCNTCHDEHAQIDVAYRPPLNSDKPWTHPETLNPTAPGPAQTTGQSNSDAVASHVIEQPALFDHKRREHQTQNCAACHQQPNSTSRIPGHRACIQCHQVDFTSAKSRLCEACHPTPVDAKGTLLDPAVIKKSYPAKLLP
ncbi:MAG TPA: hypothetical protein VKA60_04695 [Blastocatellia bacterium]|nr:hypothetical protein [Blastocatellia bacterium]